MADNIESPVSIKSFINDPKAQEVALTSAKQIIQLMGVNWFTAIDLCSVMQGIGLSEMIQKLDALKLFGFIYEKTIEGKENKYKVTLSNNHRLKLLEMDIVFYKDKIKMLEREVEKVKNKIAKAES